MLARAERLTKTALFQRAYTNRKSVSTPLVTLYVLERQPKSAPRLPFVGFVIGKKEQVKATERNRAKRRIREAYRRLVEGIKRHTDDRPYNLEYWYVLVWHIKAEAAEAPFQEIVRNVEHCLSEATAKYTRPRSRTSVPKAVSPDN